MVLCKLGVSRADLSVISRKLTQARCQSEAGMTRRIHASSITARITKLAHLSTSCACLNGVEAKDDKCTYSEVH